MTGVSLPLPGFLQRVFGAFMANPPIVHRPLVAPQPPIRWDHTPEQITSGVDEAIEQNLQALNAVAALRPEECNFDSVFRALALAEARLETIISPLLFYFTVSHKKENREASIAAEKKLVHLGIESRMRLDIYEAMRNAEKNIDFSSLLPERQRLVRKMLDAAKRNGLALSTENREIFLKLKKDLADAAQQFYKNGTHENGGVEFAPEELKGVPPAVMDGLEKVEGGRLRVSFKAPDLQPVLQYCQVPATRQKVFMASEERLTNNVPVLNEMLGLRRQIARLLDYSTWAAYILDDRMAKTTEAVSELLDDLQQKSATLGYKELEVLQTLKRAELEELGLPLDDEIYCWDARYYSRKAVEASHALDQNLVKEHFPVDHVVQAILDIYSELLNVRVEEVEDAVVWYPDVKQYSAWELDAKDESGFLGYIHLDLFSRDNKFGGAAEWSLIPGFDDDGKRVFPVVNLIANLAKSTPERKALIAHEDVLVLFHEMGHVWHDLLSRTEFSRFHGTRVAKDFVEAPSQMLEHWCYEKSVLRRMSSHFETGAPLSDEMIQKIIDSRYTNIGLLYLHHLFLSKYDQLLHRSAESVDATQLWNTMREEISLVKSPAPADYQPGFGSMIHLSGYDAQYYAYAYSIIFAYDMFFEVFKKDPLDPVAGKRYRDEILRPGGSRDELVSLEAFLGRPPNSDAYVQAVFGRGGQH